MPLTPQQFQAQDDAFLKQWNDQQTAQKAQAAAPKAPESPWSSLLNTAGSMVGKITLPGVDALLSAADLAKNGANSQTARQARDVASGVAGAVKNTMGVIDTVGSPADPNDPANAPAPIWEHAKGAIQDFRDAVALKDPTLSDNLLQFAAQTIPGYVLGSKALSELHGVANVVGAGAVTDATALDPHAPRFADILKTLQQTDGKIGQFLQAAGPYGINAYINYLSDRGNETEAQGRFKNALDGLLPNFLGTELIHAAGITVKQGTAGLRYMIDNGVASRDMLGIQSAAAQRGAVGDLTRAPLRQNYDPAEALLDDQVRRDADAAHAAPPGTPRPPLRQGGDPAAGLYDAQARADAEAVAKKVGGTIVYHGTPYDFDAFDSAQIGTGEGNQTFGHGTYFAENPKTAGHYQNMLVPQTGALGVAMTGAQKAVDAAGGRAQAYAKLSQQFATSKDPAERQQLQQQMSLIRSGNYTRGQGTLVHAEIANEHLDSMMHWDQPISQQPQLQKLISNLNVKIVPEGSQFRVTLNGKPGGLFADQQAAQAATFHLRGEGRSGEWNGGALYDNLAVVLGSQQAASEFLARRGIHGIKYLDQGSRDAGEGTHNIVLFNEKHAKVVKKEKPGA